MTTPSGRSSRHGLGIGFYCYDLLGDTRFSPTFVSPLLVTQTCRFGTLSITLFLFHGNFATICNTHVITCFA